MLICTHRLVLSPLHLHLSLHLPHLKPSICLPSLVYLIGWFFQGHHESARIQIKRFDLLRMKSEQLKYFNSSLNSWMNLHSQLLNHHQVWNSCCSFYCRSQELLNFKVRTLIKSDLESITYLSFNSRRMQDFSQDCWIYFAIKASNYYSMTIQFFLKSFFEPITIILGSMMLLSLLDNIYQTWNLNHFSAFSESYLMCAH